MGYKLLGIIPIGRCQYPGFWTLHHFLYPQDAIGG